MERLRQPFQGIGNIIRFNWHFYIGVFLFCIALFYCKKLFSENFNLLFNIVILLALIITSVTLLISFYIYDLSGLYKLNWLPNSSKNIKIININAGFDESSKLLKLKYPKCDLTVLDFYDPSKHTEISIKRARKAYAAYPTTLTTATNNLPLPDNCADKIFLIFSAHEIRNENERVIFFNELNRVLKNDGEIYVTEHLRDLSNFLAYNIGFMHFLTINSWVNVFAKSGMTIKSKKKLNPFITNFTLSKNGITT